MSFRSGVSILLELVFPEGRVSSELHGPPSAFSLRVHVLQRSIERRGELRRLYAHFHVCRGTSRFLVENDRDVEELGGAAGRETLFVTKEPPAGCVAPLRLFPLSREDFPVALYAGGAVSGARAALAAISRDGFFTLRLSAEQRATVEKLYDASERFFAQTREAKQRLLGATVGRYAPARGYRSVDALCKELYVYRAGHELPVLLQGAMDAVFDMFLDMGVSLMRDMMAELGMSGAEIGARLEGIRDVCPSPEYVQFCSFLEIFRYSGEPTTEFCAQQEGTVKVLCREHRDVGILTFIPHCRGPCGLEMFSWESGWVQVERSMAPDECVVFPGELFDYFTGHYDVPATSHRVVFPQGRGLTRLSAPFELLPHPLLQLADDKGVVLQAHQYAAGLGKNLVSENN